MKLQNVSKGLPRVIMLGAFALLLCSILINIVQSASTHTKAGKSSPDATPTVFNKPALVGRYQQTITPEALAARLYFLASDLFEGRETATRGQKLAAQYLASQYRLMGLAPKGTSGQTAPLSPAAYFQPFTVYKRTPKETHLEVLAGGSRVASSTFSAESHDDLSYFLTGTPVKAGGGVVFAGYGIADDNLGYNDYAALAAQGISVDGKWVMVLSDEPLSADAKTSLLPTADHSLSKWSETIMPKKRALLAAAGRPAGVLLVRYPSPRMQGTFADNAARAALGAQGVGNVSLTPSPFPPTYTISSKLADQILASSGKTVEDLRREINQSLKPTVFDVKDVQVNTTVEQFKGLETENVLAFIEGSDPQLKSEVVVITSHYDHLGLNPTLKGDQIFNGAADDGSGVVASLELAQAFMKAKQEGFGPRRSILFINFSAEEKGTLGSSHYVQREPLVALDQTVAEINMDGVGGVDAKHPTSSRNYIYIVGEGKLSQEVIETNRRVRELTNIKLDLTDGPANFGSDHQNFQAQLIPFIYYSTGLTEHYHQPNDEPDTIDYEHLARVARLVFGTAWQLANQDARPQSVNRRQMSIDGYVCPPCRFECDGDVYPHPGECPVCGMSLVPKYRVSGDSNKKG
jgi:hypothetical protein